MAWQQLYQPHPALRPYVRYYWSFDLQTGGESLLNLQVMADRFPRVVIQCMYGKNALYSAHYNCIYAASLKGITSKPALFQMEPTYSHVAVSFFPHGIKALFGIDGYETIDAVLDLQHFFPSEVIEKIIGARQTQARISLLDNHLLKRHNVMKTIDSRVINFLHLCPNINYGRQLKDYGISERQFERKFLQSVGFTPSYYRRVVRFERALYRLQHDDYQSLPNLAYELGYADQSHFNRDFKQFSGLTPLSLITKNELLKESGSLLEE
ncbi:helix-turn-helix domain-containing protein [Chryseosolibacter indicus]|uniref:Helix-turn-helix transcriptional regulator n=1 Tax=Chryseosolibacter indicus TaxID=2782351 RepID=A0ABS5VWV2_9BACT|nr:helix-turn-helix domain-containing protein [Chryseosolibacter indicus]MBT1705898.1 helix-turn-helix transcriptional regulator [Chryseosolibacter indicus]